MSSAPFDPAPLRRELDRRRALGEPFETAWPATLDAMHPEKPERRGIVLSTRALLEEQADAWRSAYDREPAPRKHAATVALADVLSEASEVLQPRRVLPVGRVTGDGRPRPSLDRAA